VSCASASACTAVGDAVPEFDSPETLVERWDGERWSDQSAPNPQGGVELEGVSCPSLAACKAVGIGARGPGVAETWDGLGWSVDPG
jgi:hypothetical protein